MEVKWLRGAKVRSFDKAEKVLDGSKQQQDQAINQPAAYCTNVTLKKFSETDTPRWTLHNGKCSKAVVSTYAIGRSCDHISLTAS